MVERVGFEPTRNLPTSGLQPGALPNERPLLKWYAGRDLNPQKADFKSAVYANSTTCALFGAGGGTRTHKTRFLRPVAMPIRLHPHYLIIG